jgi:PadR family transcriptional regulator, regulatory protein PadR
MKQKKDVQQGMLALMVLRTLDVVGPLHGYGIARRIEQTSGDLLSVNQGTLYPVLLRLEQEGAIASEWGPSENNRRARFYRRDRTRRCRRCGAPLRFRAGGWRASCKIRHRSRRRVCRKARARSPAQTSSSKGESSRNLRTDSRIFSRNWSSDMGVRETPTTAKPGESRRSYMRR